MERQTLRDWVPIVVTQSPASCPASFGQLAARWLRLWQRQLGEALAHRKKLISAGHSARLTKINRAEQRAGSRQGNSRLHYVASRKTASSLAGC